MNNCKYAQGNRCLVAERIADAPVTIRTDQACQECLKTPSPRAKNMVTLSLAISGLYMQGDKERSAQLVRSSRPWREANGLKRVITWSQSIRRWKDAGKPVRSDEEVERILREHCEPCEHYNHKWKQCKLCGCFCRQKGRAQFNKPKMATEQCPLEPPKWG